MKSAFECFQHAARCEQLAETARNDSIKAALLQTAKYWRKLGEQAKTDESTRQTFEPTAARRH